MPVGSPWMDCLPSIHRRVGDEPRHGRQLDARRLESQRTSWMARVDDDRSFVTDGSLTKWMMLRHRRPPTVRFLRLFLTSSCIPRRGAPLPYPPLSLFPSSAVQEGPRTDGPGGPTPPWEGPLAVRPFARESEKGNGPPFFRRFFPSGSSLSFGSIRSQTGGSRPVRPFRSTYVPPFGVT